MTSTSSLRTPQGCESVASMAENFDYYTKPMVESAQYSSVEEKFMPRNGITSDPYEFEIDTNDTFLSMNDIMLFCKAEIVKKDGTAVEEKTVAPINGLLTSMWKSIETKVNNVIVNPASSYNSAYKAYIENILSYESVTDGALEATRFVMDTRGKFDTPAENKGWEIRGTDLEKGSFDMCGIIHSDFLRSSNHLSPGNRLSLKFVRHSDEFLLQSKSGDTEEYKLKILDLVIYARRITLTTEGLRALYNPPQTERYINVHTELKDFPISYNLTKWTGRLNSGGRVPKMIIVAMVSTKSISGEYSTNPFNFQHFDIKKINLKLNGMQIPQEPLEPDWDTKQYARSYLELFKNTGKYHLNERNLVSYGGFANGCTIFPFDLTPDQCNGYHIHGGQEGVLELDIEWKNPLPTPISILVYMTGDQVVLLTPGSTNPVETSVF